MIRFSSAFFAAMLPAVMISCSGEDRSGEMPKIPVVRTVSSTVSGDSCTMRGLITESHNSSVRECGFIYGSDSVKDTKLMAGTAWDFHATADSLAAGTYHCIAYARNGMGTAYGDTVYFSVSSRKSK